MEPQFVEVLGVKLAYRVVGCNPNRPPSSNFKMTVQVTDACPASCKFCCNPGKGLVLDVERFKRDYEEILKKVFIDEVYFTGGEPLLFWDRIKECLKVIEAPVIINTMGLYLDRVDEAVPISLSRHHWDHGINEEILGVKIPEGYAEKYPWKDGSNITCNVIKGYVDTADRMRKILDFSIDSGFPLTGFNGLMPATDYAKDNRMVIPELDGDDILVYAKNEFVGGTCRCSNRVYERDGQLHRFYVKQNFCPSENRGGRIFYRNGIQPWFLQK